MATQPRHVRLRRENEERLALHEQFTRLVSEVNRLSQQVAPIEQALKPPRAPELSLAQRRRQRRFSATGTAPPPDRGPAPQAPAPTVGDIENLQRRVFTFVHDVPGLRREVASLTATRDDLQGRLKRFTSPPPQPPAERGLAQRRRERRVQARAPRRGGRGGGAAVLAADDRSRLGASAMLG